jgi:hypothetical protein
LFQAYSLRFTCGHTAWGELRQAQLPTPSFDVIGFQPKLPLIHRFLKLLFLIFESVVIFLFKTMLLIRAKKFTPTYSKANTSPKMGGHIELAVEWLLYYRIQMVGITQWGELRGWTVCNLIAIFANILFPSNCITVNCIVN